jgi:GntR family transcriptional regulator
MFICIEPDSDTPIYTQITNQIIEGIAKREIRSGDSLPSVRGFAADLGINMHTVNKSYHELEKKGIIQIIPKSGAVISSQEEMKAQNESAYERISDHLRPIIAEALVIGMGEEQIYKKVKAIIHDFAKQH